MPKEISIRLKPEFAFEEKAIRKEIARISGISEPFHFKIIRQSLDARKTIAYQFKIHVYPHGEKAEAPSYPFQAQDVSQAQEVAIVGAGPAGLFAALELIQKGLKPIVFERGKDVRSRRRDLAKLNKEHIVNPESNYCFGEGGAGTYSDGKLYTRSKKRGSVRKVLESLVQFGADENILYVAHPHIGTNKLPQIITGIREAIVEAGGEVCFESKVTDIHYDSTGIKWLEINGNEKQVFDRVILATGHSARDIIQLLHRKNVALAFQSYGLGVRIEHPQAIIDEIQYNRSRGEYLPPAAYSLVEQIDGLGVHSFCMCPGGIIAPCATAPEEVVTNGWSPSKRNNPYANSGMVVRVEASSIPHYKNALSGLDFQSQIEKKAWHAGGERQSAPAQRLNDFVLGKSSSSLPKCSYQPGVIAAELNEVLPSFIHQRLQAAFKIWGKKMKGFMTSEAIVVGVESRSSSPVRIPRDKESLQHIEVKGLYPCGEGAGYAGGIVSAAIDGMRCAEQIAISYI